MDIVLGSVGLALYGTLALVMFVSFAWTIFFSKQKQTEIGNRLIFF